MLRNYCSIVLSFQRQFQSKHLILESISRRFNYYSCQKFLTMSTTTATTDQALLDLVKDVDIDPKGRFKYILVKIYVDKGETNDTTLENELFKFVVRGYASCEYHADIYDRLTASIDRLGLRGTTLSPECVGGGRILHETKKLSVFGYSQGYGKADHEKSVEILKKQYPDYDISWSNEGY